MSLGMVLIDMLGVREKHFYTFSDWEQVAFEGRFSPPPHIMGKFYFVYGTNSQNTPLRLRDRDQYLKNGVVKVFHSINIDSSQIYLYFGKIKLTTFLPSF